MRMFVIENRRMSVLFKNKSQHCHNILLWIVEKCIHVYESFSWSEAQACRLGSLFFAEPVNPVLLESLGKEQNKELNSKNSFFYTFKLFKKK